MPVEQVWLEPVVSKNTNERKTGALGCPIAFSDTTRSGALRIEQRVATAANLHTRVPLCGLSPDHGLVEALLFRTQAMDVPSHCRSKAEQLARVPRQASRWSPSSGELTRGLMDNRASMMGKIPP